MQRASIYKLLETERNSAHLKKEIEGIFGSKLWNKFW